MEEGLFLRKHSQLIVELADVFDCVEALHGFRGLGPLVVDDDFLRSSNPALAGSLGFLHVADEVFEPALERAVLNGNRARRGELRNGVVDVLALGVEVVELDFGFVSGGPTNARLRSVNKWSDRLNFFKGEIDFGRLGVAESLSGGGSVAMLINSFS